MWAAADWGISPSDLATTGYDNTIMLITVAILVIIVQIFQEVGMWIATKSDRRK